MTDTESADATKMQWGPTVDPATCDGCRVCVDFCQNGVYAYEDGKARVVNRGACILGCSHCATLCERGAISFPPLEAFRHRHT